MLQSLRYMRVRTPDANTVHRQTRTDAVAFVIGDVVFVKDVGRGVVTGWNVARSHAFADLHVTYDILPHVTPTRCVQLRL